MQKSENNIIKIRNNNPIIFTIILIILFIISVSYIALFNNNNKSSAANNSSNVKDIATTQMIYMIEQSNLVNEEPTKSKLKEDPAIILDYKNIVKNDLNKDNNILLGQLPSQPKPKLAKYAINDYRNYLYNVNLLVSKFLQGSDYSRQIHEIDTIKLPQEIANILVDLNNYNQKFLLDNNENIRIFPQTNCWINKFIKIEKKSSIVKDKEMLKSKIMVKLDFFINFFYSEKLQQEFIE